MDNVAKKVDGGLRDLGEKVDRVAEKLDRSIQKTEEFHSGMTEKFEYLDVKYGSFSETLCHLETDIKEMKNAFLKLVDHLTGDRT